jgi:carboxymethylenebutenolidase
MANHTTCASKQGKKLGGALSLPNGSEKAGAVVVIHEWWGLNDYVESLCDRLAQAGFIAFAPDLYHGARPKTQPEAAQQMQMLDTKSALAEIGDAAAFAAAHDTANGKAGVIGFCLGGALALAATRSVPGIAAVVAFYGLPDLPLDEYAGVKVPIQAHFGKRDDRAKPSVAEQIQKKVQAGGGHMDLYVYDAGHAFMRSTDPQVYDAASAALAWPRAIDFLKSHLAE